MRWMRASSVLAALLGLGLAAFSPPARPQAGLDPITEAHDRCVRLTRTNPKQALEQARIWRESGGSFAAEHCMAMALYELHDFTAAAKQFEALATRMMQMPPLQRAQSLAQAGQAWIAAGNSAQAKVDFDAALALSGGDPDVYIDRAQALAMTRNYWEAIDDLNHVIEVSPGRADAYIYRGAAYRYVEALDLAMEDIEKGLSLAPNNIDGLLERGTLFRLKGDLVAARRDWTRVIELAPRTPEAQAARTNLAALGGGKDHVASGPRKKGASATKQ